MKYLSRFDIRGQKALIVGGASGIGQATAQLFAEAGADIVIADIDVDNAERAASVIAISNPNVDTSAVRVDVTDETSVEDMVITILEHFGHIDILVNSAGINHKFPASDLDLSDWETVLNINLKGTFLCCQYVGRQMITQQHGRIINLASWSGLVSSMGDAHTAYSSSKGGVIMLTKSLAVEWAKYNINVNALAPGHIVTPASQEWMKNSKQCKAVLDLIPMARFGDATEIASSALFLASKASSYITGTVLMVDGGYTCH